MCSRKPFYNSFGSHLKEKFGEKVYKVTLDAGFSCPNRDGTISRGGCIFCDGSGSFSCAHDSDLIIEKQLETGIENMRMRFKAGKFFSYFQAYTNTYKPTKELAGIYESGLKHKDVVGISIGTRPDCVDEEKLDLISSYTKNFYTWIEYGLQSTRDKTLKRINRGHNYDCFLRAYEKTKERGINVCVHVILGLPGENEKDMLETASELARLEVDGVKFHCLCAAAGTKIAQMYERGEFVPMKEHEYVRILCDCLEILPETTTIHRLTGNGLRTNLIAPLWLKQKFKTLNLIDKTFEERGSRQGSIVAKV